MKRKLIPIVILAVAIWPCFAQKLPVEWVLHDGLTPGDVVHLDKAIGDALPHLLKSLKLDTIMPVKVQVWREEENYQLAMEQDLGSRAPGSRGYVTGATDVRILYHRRLSAQKEAIHEFVHALSLQVNSDFGNNPRWLWEGVAQYLAGERRDSDRASFSDRPCPSLTKLNAAFDGGGIIYRYGFSIVDFIERTWGHRSVLALIKNSGDIESALQISEQKFDQLWCEHLQEL